MTHDTHNEGDAQFHDGMLPEALRFELRALRRDVPPATDLWPSIAARLAATPQSPVVPAKREAGWRRLAPLATAASLALAIGIGWQLRPADAPAPVVRAPVPAASPARLAGTAPTGVLVSRAAEAMTLEYNAALKVIDTSGPGAPASPALQVLDQSAAQIRTALARNPDSRFLLDRLQRTYTRRLALTQRLAAHETLAS